LNTWAVLSNFVLFYLKIGPRYQFLTPQKQNIGPILKVSVLVKLKTISYLRRFSQAGYEENKLKHKMVGMQRTFCQKLTNVAQAKKKKKKKSPSCEVEQNIKT